MDPSHSHFAALKLSKDKSPLSPVCSAGPALTMGRSRTSTRPRACCHTVPSTCLSLLVNVLICSLYVSSLWLAYYQFIELCTWFFKFAAVKVNRDIHKRRFEINESWN